MAKKRMAEGLKKALTELVEHEKQEPKILLLDIETAPILAYVWDIWEQNISLAQIKEDWSILSWSAKWLDNSKIMYMDQRNAKDVKDDKKLLEGIWQLIDDADIIVTQNGKAFDIKKLNARFIMQGMKPPSDFKHHDTKKIASKHFGFTSNKLEYLAENLNEEHKKMKNSGFSLWKRCLDGDVKAFKEMEEYNKQDVLSLEELYKKLRPWEPSVNYSMYYDGLEQRCVCGSIKLESKGYRYTSVGKYKVYRCKSCGKSYSGKQNLLSKEKRKSMLK